MAALEVTSRQFRDNQKTFFDLADEGKQIIIKRGRKKSYVLSPVQEDDLYFTPQMLERIDRALEQIEHGECTVINSEEGLTRYFDNI
jgi:hypothetical protein